MLKEKYCTAEKLAILGEIASGEIGIKDAAKKYGITKTTLAKWRRRYKVYGYEGLERRGVVQSHENDLGTALFSFL